MVPEADPTGRTNIEGQQASLATLQPLSPLATSGLGATPKSGIENEHKDQKGNQKGQEKDEVAFWGDDPNALLQPAHILEFYPVSTMTYAQQLNAITRSVLVLTVVLCLLAGHWVRTCLVAGLTLGAIYVLYMQRMGRTSQPNHGSLIKEGFGLAPLTADASPAMGAIAAEGLSLPADVFQEPTSRNPFSNVMVPDYELNPGKLPAPPMDRPEVADQVLQQTVKMVQETNPGQPGITDKLFRDVNDQLNFEQSMRPFMSNPATTIPNDQGAFAQFCYGSMVSCKEGNLFACARNTSRYQT